MLATGDGASAIKEQSFQVAACTDNDRDNHYAIDPVNCPLPLADDCDDNDAERYPGAPEQCNGKDNNCNGVIAEGACDTICPLPFGSTLNVASGALEHDQELFATNGPDLAIPLALHYHSLDPWGGALGLGWMHSYETILTAMPDGSVIVRDGSGRQRVYQPTAGGYQAQKGDYATLTRDASGWTLVEKSGLSTQFNTTGQVLSLTDRNDNRITLTYAQGLLTEVLDAVGRRTTFTYNAQNRLRTITDVAGNRHTFTYSAGRLATVSTQDTLLTTRTWSYTYHASGLLHTRTDPDGQLTTYTYNSTGKVTASTDPEGLRKKVTYQPAQSTTQVTFPDGGLWTYRYSARLGVLTRITDALGASTTFSYNSNKHLTSRTAPDGTITRFTVDSQGNRTAVTDALGATTTATYNAFGQVTRLTGPRGDITTFSYDARGNLRTHTDTSGAVTRLTYDARGDLLTLTDALGQRTTLTYNAQRTLSTLTDPTGALTSFTSDVAGNRTSQTDALGNTTALAYSSLNQLLQVTDPHGAVTTFTYNRTGNLLTQTDAAGNRTTFTYNARGQRTAVQDALGGVTTFTYGTSGCGTCGGGAYALTQVTDAKGQTTRYTYDLAGRLLAETDPLGNVVTYTYDLNGRLLSRTDATGATIHYTSDALGRLLRKQFPDQTSADYTYDASGNLLTATNPSVASTFTYDLRNRLTAVSDSRGLTLGYTYDALGRRTALTYPDGTTAAYSYDPASRLASLTHAGRTVTLAYDRSGRRDRMALPNGTTTSYAYDRSSQLTALTHQGPSGTVLQQVTYAYDAVGNRTRKTDLSGTFRYTYDAEQRLVAASTPLPALPQESFTYDLVGNRLDSTWNGVARFNAGNQLLDDADFTYQYDANGNRTRKTAKVGGAFTRYIYDAEQRLVRVVTPSGTTVRYTYDALGRRITKTVTAGTTTVTQYVYDQEDIILERDETNTVTARYTHGPGIDEPLLLEQGGQRYVYHADGLGSILALTDTAGVVRQPYTYAAFGTLVSPGAATVAQPYTFTGREFDADTGLYYYRARTYDAATGRFLQRDPIGFAGGDLNLYGYVGNNPVNTIDPLGLAGLDSLSTRVTALMLQGRFAEALALAEGGGLVIVSRLQRMVDALQRLQQRYPIDSNKCDALAKESAKLFQQMGANPQILKISPTNTRYVVIGDQGFIQHYVVKVGDVIYDATTGTSGMPYDLYIKLLEQINNGPGSFLIH